MDNQTVTQADNTSTTLSIPQVINTIKSGYKTTEFWTTVLGLAWTGYQAYSGKIDPATATKVIGGVSAIYSIARSIAKKQ